MREISIKEGEMRGFKLLGIYSERDKELSNPKGLNVWLSSGEFSFQLSLEEV